ncbi:MAG: Imm10 family immunity protein [Paludisphaera borealis]|uniref:Imm10 family immunity protein n=1 Tax=Paludisphaera borealis TaxID=1387353 RepID=UPI00284FF272|nr:Imm10 family immunity protein [Paludisphaera borealis]MDR3623206.1 Imm10 family immunity protein [Paludisphaera borealis]
MRITFRAVRGVFQEDEELLSAGFDAGADWAEKGGHFLSLQRSAEGLRGDLEDWEADGLYVELDDQVYSGYGVVRECRLSRGMLSVDLETPIEDDEEIEGFDVELAIDDKSFDALKAGLPRIIEGSLAQLVVVE